METKSIIISSFFLILTIILLYIVKLYKTAKRIEIRNLVNDLSYEISQKDFVGLDYKLFNSKFRIRLINADLREKGILGQNYSYKNYYIVIRSWTIDENLQGISVTASNKSFEYTKTIHIKNL